MKSNIKRRLGESVLRRLAPLVETRRWARAIFERSVGRPTLHELSLLAPLTYTPDEFLADLLGDEWARRKAALLEEHAAVQSAITRRAGDVASHYPNFFTVEDGTALVLYAIVRILAPAVVIETGVADGRSTATMLAAMDRNEMGMLHSVDIARDVGSLVTNRTRWRLHVIRPDQPLLPVLGAAGPADVFLHDADHTSAGQQRDAAAALRILCDGGLFLSDDADWSYAFHDTCRALQAKPALLLDRRKVFGAVRVRRSGDDGSLPNG